MKIQAQRIIQDLVSCSFEKSKLASIPATCELIRRHFEKNFLQEQKIFHCTSGYWTCAGLLLLAMGEDRIITLCEKALTIKAYNDLSAQNKQIPERHLAFKVPSIMRSAITAQSHEAIELLEKAIITESDEEFFSSYFNEELKDWFVCYGRPFLSQFTLTQENTY